MPNTEVEQNTATVPEKDKVLAIIDLGSNSARLLLVRIMPNGATTVLNRVKHMVRLGENAFQKKLLQDVAMNRTMQVLKAFAAMCKTYRVDECIAIATAAVRDARNGKDFIQKVRLKTGLTFTVISGSEEARLVYLGVSSGLPYTRMLRLFIDIGGGSTELAVANSAEHKNLDSLKLGCVRLTNQFLGEESGPVSAAQFAEMQAYVRRTASHEFARVSALAPQEVFASSGTAQTLQALTWRHDHNNVPPSAENDVLETAALRRFSQHLCTLSFEERRALPNVRARRADVLVAGAAILLTILEELGLEKLRITNRNLQDGILVDYLSKRKGDTSEASVIHVREHSIRQLALRCGVEENHAQHIVRLTLHMHDSAVDAGLIALNHTERELLSYSAFLHDIGIFIAFSHHSNHSYYLIRNTELLGFTENEIEFMALLALTHNKPISKKTKQMENLSEDMRKRMRILSLFLALAENMDRLHCQHITDAEFNMQGSICTLYVHSDSESPVEKEAVLEMEKDLKKIFALPIRIEFVKLK